MYQYMSRVYCRAHKSVARCQCDSRMSSNIVRLLVTGDVMMGRGIDQILPHHCTPELYESCVDDAREYVKLAVARNGPLQKARDYSYPWGFALADMDSKAPDARLINLETAITTSSKPWPKKSINYRMHPENIPALTCAKIDVATLANNHVLDWCQPGLIETLDTLHHAGIQTAGAGLDASEAQAPAILAIADKNTRVLVFAMGHKSSGVYPEWKATNQGCCSTLSNNTPGIFYTDFSAQDVDCMARLVQKYKQPGDIVVLSVHWGGNWGYEIPDEQQKFAASVLDSADVDIIWGHSSHHIKGAALHHGTKLLLWGCGDILSDYEGITNVYIEHAFPKEEYKDTVGCLWYVDIDTSDGRCCRLMVTVTRLRHLRLEEPSVEDVEFVKRVLMRECGKWGAIRVEQVDDKTLEIVYPDAV